MRLGSTAPAALAVLLLACGNNDTTGSAGPGSGGEASSSSTTSSAGGSGGHAPAIDPPDAGIDACNAAFVEQGVCRPSASKCPAGQAPNVDKGCVAVGVQGCKAAFLDARGACIPKATDCPTGQFPLPTLGCVSIDGDAGCGTAPFGNIADDPSNVYVDPTYAGGDSDGSLTKPLLTIADALAVATTGGTVVLAAGTYTGNVVLSRSVNLRGRCASMVTLTGADGKTQPQVAMSGPGPFGLRGVTVTNKGVGVLLTQGTATIEEIVVSHAMDVGIYQYGGTQSTVRRTLVQDMDVDTVFQPVNGSGYGIVSQTGTMDVHDSAVIRGRSAAADAFGTGQLSLDDVFLADTLPDKSNYAYGVSSDYQSVFSATNTVITNNAIPASLGGNATLDHCVVVGATQPMEAAVYLDGTNPNTVSHSFLADVTYGIWQYEGSLASEGNLIAATNLAAAQQGGGVLQSSGTWTSTDDVIVGATGYALNLSGASATLSGLVVDGVAPNPTQNGTFGAILGSGVTASLSRSYFHGIGSFGVLTLAAAPATTTVDKCFFETLHGEGQQNGVAVAAGGGGQLSVTSTRIEDVAGAGVLSTGAPLVVDKTYVKGVGLSAVSLASYPLANGVPGVGDGIVLVQGTSPLTASITQSYIEGCAGAGILLAGGAGTVTDTRATGNAFGLVTQQGGTVVQQGDSFDANAMGDVIEAGSLPVP